MFLNRSFPFFPRMDILLKPREQRLIKTDSPFMAEIPGIAII